MTVYPTFEHFEIHPPPPPTPPLHHPPPPHHHPHPITPPPPPHPHPHPHYTPTPHPPPPTHTTHTTHPNINTTATNNSNNTYYNNNNTSEGAPSNSNEFDPSIWHIKHSFSTNRYKHMIRIHLTIYIPVSNTIRVIPFAVYSTKHDEVMT